MTRTVMRLAASCAVMWGSLTGVQAWSQELSVEVLSSFPELVTGGDALVKVTGASGAPTVTAEMEIPATNSAMLRQAS